MQVRQYEIQLQPQQIGLLDRTGLETTMGCVVTEPSGWITAGATNLRGLTFTDIRGRILDHHCLKHLPLFHMTVGESESNEIRIILQSRLLVDYQLSSADVAVIVKPIKI